MAAAVGVPDPIRTESIKAFVVLRDGFSPSRQLVDEIRNFVRDHWPSMKYRETSNSSPDCR
jgi:acetyl-CoA synthetase